jgi:uncharacterized protein YlxW (UPF0749 family)
MNSALKEKDAEIERLRQYACQCEASVHSTQEGYAELQDKIERLKARIAFMASNDYVHSLTSLITRAADVLEKYGLSDDQKSLIAELRKAAE